MPKFTTLDPIDVAIGRGRNAMEARKPYIDTLKAGDAGKIDLERGDRPAVVKRLLSEASKQVGVKVRSSWSDKSQRTLLWKKTKKR